MKRSPKKSAAGLVTRAKLAASMGVVPHRVNVWETQGCPCARKGAGGRPSLFDPVAVKAWLAARDQATQARAGVGSLPDERARESRAKTMLAEQTLRIRSGELVPSAELESAWLELHEAVATTVAAIPKLADRLVQLAREGGAAAVARCLDEAIEQALTGLSSWKPRAQA